MTGRRLCAAVGLLALSGCGGGKRLPVALPPAPVVMGGTEEGLASWYGHPYHGRATSSGEIYDMEQLTAAHRTFPLGTRVEVENLSNGRSVEVRINDRGPFVGDRIIDVSRAAARSLQMLGPGTARVRLRVIGLAETSQLGFYVVQVGAFQDRDNADRLRAAMARDHGSSFLQAYESGRRRFYRVLVGRETELERAEELASRLRSEGFPGYIVRVDAAAGQNPL